MENPKTAIVIASVIGASAGIFSTSFLNPMNNHYAFLAIFILLGVCLANIALLIVNGLYEWLNKRSITQEKQISPIVNDVM